MSLVKHFDHIHIASPVEQAKLEEEYAAIKVAGKAARDAGYPADANPWSKRGYRYKLWLMAYEGRDKI